MVSRRADDHWAEVDGRRVFWKALPSGSAGGSRPPLLLIHGISCCTGTWGPFIRALAGREDAPRVLVPDFPAHGRSQRADRILGMAEFAAWTERFLRRIELDGPVDVMGHSMGCQVALALADLCPDRVRRLVLLGPTTGGRHVSAVRNGLGLALDSTREPLSYNMLLMEMFLRMGPLRYLLTVREMQRDDAFLRAARIPAETLVLQGARDAIIPKRVGVALAGALPRGEHMLIPGAAHAAQYSHPGETADAVLSFTG